MQDVTTSLTRRSFVTAAGATAAAATASTIISAAQADETEEPAVTGTPENRWQSQAAADWRVAPEPVAEDQIVDGGTYDVVIVGGGQSGTWTARAAAMNGASVAVLEAGNEDTFIYIGGEVAVANSQWALDKGAETIEKQDFLDEWGRRCAGRANLKIVRNFVDYSGKIMDWSIEEVRATGSDIYDNTDQVNIYSAESDDRMVMDPSGFKFYKTTIVHRPVDQGGSGWCWGPVVMTHHREKAIEDGATWCWDTHAEYLEKDADGRVVSVVAHNTADDTYVRYTATRGVALCAGDFLGNEDMLRDINDEYRHLAEAYGDIELAVSGGMGLRDGSSIKLGVWAGGHVEVGPRTGMNTGQSGVEAGWGPGFMLLNQRGLRYCNECAGGTEGSGYLSPRQPRGAIVALADANYLDTVYAMPPAHGAVNLTSKVTFNGIDPLKETIAALDPATEGESESGYYCANTIEELLDKLGCFTDEQKANALAEVDKWNAYCEVGADEDFAMDPRVMKPLKTAPFYACVGRSDNLGVGLCQTTGLDTDFNGAVLDSDLMPIPGLYACGNNSGNRYIVNYCTPIAGMSLAMCMVEGMLLGARLAACDTDPVEEIELNLV